MGCSSSRCHVGRGYIAVRRGIYGYRQVQNQGFRVLGLCGFRVHDAMLVFAAGRGILQALKPVGGHDSHQFTSCRA